LRIESAARTGGGRKKQPARGIQFCPFLDALFVTQIGGNEYARAAGGAVTREKERAVASAIESEIGSRLGRNTSSHAHSFFGELLN
jgi:hypothetical protein